MQIIKEEVLPLLTNPHDPKKAEVGKLYKLQFDPLEIDADPLEFYVFDTQGRPVNRTWTPGNSNICLVLDLYDKYVVVLVGEDIIHVSNNETFWKIELVPLIDSSKSQDS